MFAEGEGAGWDDRSPSPRKKSVPPSGSQAPASLRGLEGGLLEHVCSFLLIRELAALSGVSRDVQGRRPLHMAYHVGGHFRDVFAVLAHLNRTPNLRSLDLSANELGVEGAASLTQLFRAGSLEKLEVRQPP
jgi:hypothetical protein